MENKKISLNMPGITMGYTTPAHLEKIVKTAIKFKIETLKITTAQQIRMIGVNKELSPLIINEMGLEMPSGEKCGVHYVQACMGTMTCKYAHRNTIEFGKKFKKAMSHKVYPGKVKTAISGCAFNCCEGYIRDVGIFAKKSGWTLVFGGNGGGRPKIGDVIGEGLNDDEVIALARKCLDYYSNNAKKRERTARLVTRKGIDELLKSIERV